MIVTLNIICVISSIYIFREFFKGKINAAFICLIVFDATYVLPLLVEIFLGNARLGYYGFELAQEDFWTSILYGLFILFTQACFYFYLKKSLKGKKQLDVAHAFKIMREKIADNAIFFIISIILALLPIFGILAAPNPKLYFSGIGAFVMNKVSITGTDYSYHTEIVPIFKYMGAIGVVLIKLVNKNKNLLMNIIMSFSIILIALLDGKRTFVTFLVLILMTIDLISATNDKRKMFLNIVTTFSMIALYFIAYSYITGKYEYNTNWYSVISEYFFRSNSVKVALYSVLNPNKLKILDYPFQTMIYDFLYFIPRTIWQAKPYSYPQYYTSAVFGFLNITNLEWYFQTGWYAECISNLGLIGIIASPTFILYLCKVVDKSQKVLTTVVGLFFVSMIQVFEYSDMFKVILFIWIILIIWEKIQSRLRFDL